MTFLQKRRFRRARGFINRPVALLLGSFVIVVVLVSVLSFRPQANERPKMLFVYCASGLKAPMEEIRTAYEAENGVEIQLQYGGSQSLLASLEVSRQGDLFISADEQHLVTAQTRKLVGESLAIARQHPVLAVRKGNPLQIASLESLLRSEAKLAIANPELAAIGQVAKEALTKTGEWDKVSSQATVVTTTVSEVANSLKVGAADAGIVWDQTVHQYRDSIESVALPQFDGVSATVAVGVLTSSKQASEASAFARHLAESAEAQAAFKKYGFSISASKAQP